MSGPLPKVVRRRETAHLATLLGGYTEPLPGFELKAYHQLVLVDPHVKGQLSSAMAADGGGIYLSAVFNFGDLICPSIVTFQAGGALSVGQSDCLMLVVYRMPEKTWGTRLNRVAQPPDDRVDRPAIKAVPKHRRNGDAVSPVYTCPTPTTFLRLIGKTRKGRITLAATGGINPKLPSKDELSLVLVAKLEVGGEICGLSLRDPTPLRYPSGGFSDALKADMDAEITMDLKTQAEIFLDANWIQNHNKSRRFLKEQLGNIAMAAANRALAEKPVSQPGGGDAQPVVLSAGGLFDRLRKPRSTKDYTDKLQTLLGRITNDMDDAPAKRARIEELIDGLNTRKAMKLSKQQLKASIRRKAYLGEKLSDAEKAYLAEAKPDRRPTLNGLDSRSVTVRAAIDGTAQAKATQGGAGAGASLNAAIEAQRCDTGYRFQVAADGSNTPLVMTQDTKMQRLQVDANAAIKAGGLEPPMADPLGPFEKGSTVVEKELRYNTLAYQSVIAYWRETGAQTATAYPNGSGIAFGMSMSSSRFLAWLAAEKAGKPGRALRPNKLEFTRQRLIHGLKVPGEAVHRFAQACYLDEQDFGAENMGRVSNIVIEASYAFTGMQSIPLEERGKGRLLQPKDLFELPVVKNFYGQKEIIVRRPHDPFVLDQIRLRVLVGGTSQRSQRVFHLGFTLVVGISIGLDKEEFAQSESAIDLYTWRAGEEKIEPRPSDEAVKTSWKRHEWPPNIAAELGVPPVALVHQ